MAGDECRICRAPATKDSPLYSPCRCSGSVQYCHQECLTDWLQVRGKEECEVCGCIYQFSPKFRPDMPDSLPITVIAHRSLSIFLQLALLAGQKVCVLAVWLLIIPFVAAMCLRYSLDSNATFLSTVTKSFMLGIVEWMDGLRVTLFNFLILMSGLAFRDHMAAQIKRVESDRLALAEDLENSIQVGGVQRLNDPDRDLVADDNNNNDAGGGGGGANLRELMIPANGDAVVEPINEDEIDDGGVIWDIIGLQGPILNAIVNSLFLLMLNICAVLLLVWLPRHLSQFQCVSSVETESHQTIYSLFEACKQDILMGYLICLMVFFTIPAVLIRIAGNSYLKKELNKYVNYAYLCGKVAGLSLVELLLFPLLCGIIFDLSTLPLFFSNLLEGAIFRLILWQYAPFASIFLHWFAGTLIMLTFATTFSGVKKIVRPGVMWFIRDPHDDGDFNPVLEMIEQNLGNQLRKIFSSFFVYSLFIISVFGGLTMILRVIILRNFLPFEMLTQSSFWNIVMLVFSIPIAVKSFRKHEHIFSKVLLALFSYFAKRYQLSSFFFGGARLSDEDRGLGMFHIVIAQNIFGRDLKSRFLYDSLPRFEPKKIAYIKAEVSKFNLKHTLIERNGSWSPFRYWRDPLFIPVTEVQLLESSTDVRNSENFTVNLSPEDLFGPKVSVKSTVVYIPFGFFSKIIKFVISLATLGIALCAIIVGTSFFIGLLVDNGSLDCFSKFGWGLTLMASILGFRQASFPAYLGVSLLFVSTIIPVVIGFAVQSLLDRRDAFAFGTAWSMGFTFLWLVLLLVKVFDPLAHEQRPWQQTQSISKKMRMTAIDILDSVESLQLRRMPLPGDIFALILPILSLLVVRSLFVVVIILLVITKHRKFLFDKIRKEEYLIGRQLNNYSPESSSK